jgi:hypothetical protein
MAASSITSPDVNGAPETVPEFSLLRGPIHRLARRLGRGRDEVGRLWLAAALVLLTWLPTVLLALAQDNAGAAANLPGVGVHVRFLLALPLLLLAEVWTDPHVASLVRRLVKSGIVRPTALRALAVTVRRVAGLNQWGLAEALLFVLALLLVPLDAVIDLPGEIKGWTTAGVGPEMHLTPAGWWYHAVSLTVFRFLLLRWCWRTGIWWWFLWRLSRLDLRLVSTHPDRTGGLGYLEIAQGYFATEVFALAAVFSASFAEEVQFSGVSLDALVLPVTGTALLFAVILLAPLLVFAPRLLEAKLRGLREYWELAERYVSGFDAKWIRGEPRAIEDLLGTPDLQALADLGSSLEVVRGMRVVPFGLSLVSAFAVASLVPMAPLLLLKFPLADLLTWLVRAIAGI